MTIDTMIILVFSFFEDILTWTFTHIDFKSIVSSIVGGLLVVWLARSIFNNRKDWPKLTHLSPRGKNGETNKVLWRYVLFANRLIMHFLRGKVQVEEMFCHEVRYHVHLESVRKFVEISAIIDSLIDSGHITLDRLRIEEDELFKEVKGVIKNRLPKDLRK